MTPTTARTAPPTKSHTLGKTTATDMTAAAMMQMVTAVQAATLWP